MPLLKASFPEKKEKSFLLIHLIASKFKDLLSACADAQTSRNGSIHANHGEVDITPTHVTFRSRVRTMICHRPRFVSPIREYPKGPCVLYLDTSERLEEILRLDRIQGALLILGNSFAPVLSMRYKTPVTK